MKEPITKFNFEDAFKALDDIPVPVAEKGIRANRIDLKESMRKVDKFELLFEDFYDVNDSEDMNAASEEREAEVAKAKLARIEKIVDLDAETEDDILPSYVGKIIIQCPQCMTLFYKSPEDIEKDEENPDVVNVNEACQHCGNTSGYDIIGKVAEEEEEAPAEETTDGDIEGDELGNDENDLSVEDNTEEGTDETSDEGEVDELSAEVDLDELDLEEIPDEETEEEKNESLNLSKALKDAEEESDLKTENESKKLTLNEDIDEDLDAKLKAHDEYISHLRTTIEQEEEALEKADNEQIKASIQRRLDALKADLEEALPEAVKAETSVEEPTADEVIEIDSEETPAEEVAEEETETEAAAEETEAEETTESLHEAVESMTDTLNRAWEVAKKTNSPIGVTVITPVGAGTTGKLKEWSRGVNANLYYVDAKNPDLMVTGFDEKMISRPDTIIVIDEFNRATADTQKAISNEIDNLDTQVEMVIAISHDNNINGDNFKRFKQYVVNIEAEVKEALNENLIEANTIPSASEANINKLFNSDEFKKPVSEEEVESFFEAVEDEASEEEKSEADIEVEPNEPVTEDEAKELTEAGGFSGWWDDNVAHWVGKGAGTRIAQLVGQDSAFNKLIFVSRIDPNLLKSKTGGVRDYAVVTLNDLQGFGSQEITAKTANSALKTLKKAIDKVAKQKLSSGKCKVISKDSDDVTVDALVANEKLKFVDIYLVKNVTELKVENVKSLLPNLAAAVSNNETHSDVCFLGHLDVAANKYIFNEFKANVDKEVKADKEVNKKMKAMTLENCIELIKQRGMNNSFIVVEKAGGDNFGVVRTEAGPATAIALTDAEKAKDLKNSSAKTGVSYAVLAEIVPDDLRAGTKVGKLSQPLEGNRLIAFNNGEPETTYYGEFCKAHMKEEEAPKTEALNITDIDDESFNEKLTESLRAVYKNVENFTMTDCQLNESNLVIEGTIKFISGNEKTTQYVFEALQPKGSQSITLNGNNKDLFENGNIKVSCEILSETLKAETLSYKYTIEKDLVEGLIGSK